MSFEDEVRALIKAQKEAHASAVEVQERAAARKKAWGTQFAAEAQDFLKRAEQASDAEFLFVDEPNAGKALSVAGLWASDVMLLFRFNNETGHVEYFLGPAGLQVEVGQKMYEKLREAREQNPDLRILRGWEQVTWNAVDVDSVAEKFVTQAVAEFLSEVWSIDFAGLRPKGAEGISLNFRQ